MKTSSPPYLRPYFERIEIKDWLLIKNGSSSLLGELMPEWDTATNITIAINAEVDTYGILEDCKLSRSAQLRLVSSWESTGTGLRDCGNFVDLDTNLSNQSVLLEAQIEGAMLASEVVVGVSLLLMKVGMVTERLAPKLTGSLLWRNQRKIALEGTGTRFPVEMVNFSESFSWLPENAGWFLDWDRFDFTRPVLGSVRLYVNSNHQRLKAAVNGIKEIDQALREVISFDIARTMIMTALDSEDFINESEKYADETVGAAVRRLVNTLFPSKALHERAQYRKQYPDRFECDLQDSLQLFWKE